MTRTLDETRRAVRARLATVSDCADLEARWLLMHLLDVDTTYLITHSHDALTTEDGARLERWLERRAAGEPLAYIIGHTDFWTLELNVTPEVLIPRADTETLVETALDCLDANAALAVADLGTGSGAIALALASERPHWSITATDNSAAALACAMANAERLGLARLSFHAGRWFAALDDTRFDAIVSNPPYVAPDDVHLSAVELGHEPSGALVAADAGLADINQLIESAPAHLAPGGLLLIEHGADQGAAVRRLFTRNGYRHVKTRRDLGRRERVTLGRMRGHDAGC